MISPSPLVVDVSGSGADVGVGVAEGLVTPVPEAGVVTGSRIELTSELMGEIIGSRIPPGLLGDSVGVASGVVSGVTSGVVSGVVSAGVEVGVGVDSESGVLVGVFEVDSSALGVDEDSDSLGVGVGVGTKLLRMSVMSIIGVLVLLGSLLVDVVDSSAADVLDSSAADELDSSLVDELVVAGAVVDPPVPVKVTPSVGVNNSSSGVRVGVGVSAGGVKIPPGPKIIPGVEELSGVVDSVVSSSSTGVSVGRTIISGNPPVD